MAEPCRGEADPLRKKTFFPTVKVPAAIKLEGGGVKASMAGAIKIKKIAASLILIYEFLDNVGKLRKQKFLCYQ